MEMPKVENLIFITLAVMMGLAALTYFIINIFYKANRRAQNRGTADDSQILASFDLILKNVVFWKLEQEWQESGHETRKPKGGYMPDFLSAAEKELQSVKDAGIINADDVVEAIHEHGGNPEAFRLSAVMNDEITALLRNAGYMN